jgi:hypothetical protein
MSDEFDSLDANEKAAVEGALNRCRAVVTQIVNELRNERDERFVDKLSLADFYASLERAADILGQQSRGTAGGVRGAEPSLGSQSCPRKSRLGPHSQTVARS